MRTTAIANPRGIRELIQTLTYREHVVEAGLSVHGTYVCSACGATATLHTSGQYAGYWIGQAVVTWCTRKR